MATVVSRYRNTKLSYALIKTAPRMIVATAALAIGAEWLGNGFIDSIWHSLNRGVRDI